MANCDFEEAYLVLIPLVVEAHARMSLDQPEMAFDAIAKARRVVDLYAGVNVVENIEGDHGFKTRDHAFRTIGGLEIREVHRVAVGSEPGFWSVHWNPCVLKNGERIVDSLYHLVHEHAADHPGAFRVVVFMASGPVKSYMVPAEKHENS